MEEHFVLAVMLQLWFMILIEVKYHLLGWCVTFIVMVSYELSEEDASFVFCLLFIFSLLLDYYYFFHSLFLPFKNFQPSPVRKMLSLCKHVLA